jgi:hypothetical protein
MSVKPAFHPELLSLSTASIIPLKPVTPAFRKTEVYRRIAASKVLTSSSTATPDWTSSSQPVRPP